MDFLMEKKYETCIWVITPGGLKISEALRAGLNHCDVRVSDRIADSFEIKKKFPVFKSLPLEMARCFNLYKRHICVFSTGIAVRVIAPILISKLDDPAVVVIDDKARHAISLVSGHLGGANALAIEAADITGARPVITTATDVNGLPSIDMIAGKQGLVIENPSMIKKINMAFLCGEKIHLVDPMNFVKHCLTENFFLSDSKGLGVFCSDRIEPVSRETLILRPPSLVAGIGCNRGTTKEELMAFLEAAFKEKKLSLKSLSKIATVGVKQDEKGILDLARELEISIVFYGRDELNSVKNITKPSEMVEKHLGVKSVCEAAAILASSRGNLIVPKIIRKNATLALARKNQGFL